jgi:hypothetical protein
MKPIPRLAIALLVLSLTVAASGAALAAKNGELPKKFTSPRQDKEHVRVCGIGSDAVLAEAQRAAAAHATTQIINSFGFTGRTETTHIRTELESTLSQIVRQHGPDARIKGALVEEWTYRESPTGYTVYVLVAYPRAEMEMERQRMAEARAAAIADLTRRLATAEDLSVRRDFSGAARRYAEVVRSGDQQEGAEGVATRALNGLQNTLDGLKLAIASGDTQRGLTGSGLPAPLVVSVTHGGDRAGVTGVPVTFSFGEGSGKLTESAVTGPDGRAECRVSRLPADLNGGGIRAHLDLSALLGAETGSEAASSRLASLVARDGAPVVDFRYSLLKVSREMRVLVLVDERTGEKPLRESVMAGSLQEELLAAGYRVVADVEIGKSNCDRIRQLLDKDQILSVRDEIYEMVDAIVWGVATAGAAESMSSGLYRSFADANLKIVDLIGGDLLATVNITRVKGFDTNPVRAQQAALVAAAHDGAPKLIQRLESRGTR